MAILKSLVIRGASQRLGGMVLYTRSGETIARELAPAVSNPRTRVQMEQRVKLGNVVAMYRANRFWMAGSFEDKEEKESDYNAFVRANLSSNKVALTKQHIAAGAGVVAPYQITSGSIPAIDCVGTQTGIYSNIYTGNLIITSATTVQQFTSAILANNNGIVEGMQLSLVVNLQRRNESLAVPYIVARAYEVILSLSDSTLLSEYFPDGILEIREDTGRPLAFNGSMMGDGAAAFILSQTVSGKTKVSSQSLVFYGNQSIYSIYTSAIAVNAAIGSYGSTDTRFLDSNEAKEASGVVITNYVQAMGYSSHLYTQMQEVPTNMAEGTLLSIYFAQPLNRPATVSMLIEGEQEEVELTSLNWRADDTSVVITIPGGHTLSASAEVNIYFTNVEGTIDFGFIAVPPSAQQNAVAPSSRDVVESNKEGQEGKQKK